MPGVRRWQRTPGSIAGGEVAKLPSYRRERQQARIWPSVRANTHFGRNGKAGQEGALDDFILLNSNLASFSVENDCDVCRADPRKSGIDECKKEVVCRRSCRRVYRHLILRCL
jgi:hypothetical protein